ncbi:hypothetical protein BD410DRAFT_846150 [Rickenella mellea]|uniref:Senescence domain-containing protein n=1 Tax=Rickenella mellea TaxID=50990 RepID=A0A4Y7PGK6_9AGAM|nr:hypothetical protein BD410DRAFT_846150 [Rickenella mellea]
MRAAERSFDHLTFTPLAVLDYRSNRDTVWFSSVLIVTRRPDALTDSDPDSKGAGPGLGDADLKGRLVLVDEDDGEVVGTLGDQFTITEDKGLREQGMEKDPVVVELPEDDAGRDVFVHAIPYEHQDVIMKGATLLSRGIVFATDALASGMTALSSYYISHSTPSEKPLVFSETTRKNVKRVHHISGQAVKVSAKTTVLIHGMIDKAVGYVAGKPVPPPRSRPTTPTPVQGIGSGSGNGKTSAPPPTPPRLPPRGTSSKGDPPPYQQQQQNQGSYLSTPTPESRTITPPPLPPHPPLKNRILLSTDMLLTTVENSAQNLVTHGSNALSASLGPRLLLYPSPPFQSSNPNTNLS